MARMNDAEILQRLHDLSTELPPPPKPVAAYVPVRITGAMAYVAGQVPMVDGRVMHPGRLGDPDSHVTADEASAAARQASLQVLAALREALDGSFERLAGIAQVTVYLATAPDFVEHAQVANGASDLLVAALGDEGKHARAAVGMASLPLGASVEVAAIAVLTG
jgi:enamine deaminase RidA (YjgF/YER057c/UK114 family)